MVKDKGIYYQSDHDKLLFYHNLDISLSYFQTLTTQLKVWKMDNKTGDLNFDGI